MKTNKKPNYPELTPISCVQHLGVGSLLARFFIDDY